jgi:hypothetical protein
MLPLQGDYHYQTAFQHHRRLRRPEDIRHYPFRHRHLQTIYQVLGRLYLL